VHARVLCRTWQRSLMWGYTEEALSSTDKAFPHITGLYSTDPTANIYSTYDAPQSPAQNSLGSRQSTLTTGPLPPRNLRFIAHQVTAYFERECRHDMTCCLGTSTCKHPAQLTPPYVTARQDMIPNGPAHHRDNTSWHRPPQHPTSMAEPPQRSYPLAPPPTETKLHGCRGSTEIKGPLALPFTETQLHGRASKETIPISVGYLPLTCSDGTECQIRHDPVPCARAHEARIPHRINSALP
jgi:hypothetical protein